MSNGKRALITGATSGIGAEFARRLADRGYALLLTGRRREPLEALAEELKTRYGVPVELRFVEFGNREELDRFCTEVAALHDVEFLVNNAGFGHTDDFFTDDWSHQETMITVHINTVARLCHLLAGPMLRAGKGYIVNVSSLASFLPGPTSPLYSATKACLTTLSQSFAMALRSGGVRVQALCPGFTRTDFHAKLGMERQRLVNRGLIRWMSAEAVVTTSLKGLDRGRVVVVPGWTNRLLLALTGALPRRLYYRLSEKSYRKFRNR